MSDGKEEIGYDPFMKDAVRENKSPYNSVVNFTTKYLAGSVCWIR